MCNPTLLTWLTAERLHLFLQLVWRILRPGGIFLFREHDARPDLLAMVDVAHSVFNCLTGVSLEDEANEIRGFRPIAEWRRILSSFGFLVWQGPFPAHLKDMQFYGLQETDSTEDYMLCFIKPPYLHGTPFIYFLYS